jgi:hypothetical protein
LFVFVVVVVVVTVEPVPEVGPDCGRFRSALVLAWEL